MKQLGTVSFIIVLLILIYTMICNQDRSTPNMSCVIIDIMSKTHQSWVPWNEIQYSSEISHNTEPTDNVHTALLKSKHARNTFLHTPCIPTENQSLFILSLRVTWLCLIFFQTHHSQTFFG